jgi:hypothetical protein
MKRKIHDGILGAVIAGGVALGYWVSPAWLLLPGILGLVPFQLVRPKSAASVGNTSSRHRIRFLRIK